tara:strand:- start:185 stop:880 length:696 start_codon:yes stop_codon:yes gene_type:complete
MRVHDKIYLTEDPSKIKELFVSIANEIDKDFIGSIADVGCATGAFTNYLQNRFSQASVCGIEYSDELRIKAETNFKKIRFLNGDINNRDSVTEKFDIITLAGVLGIYDDFNFFLTNILSWLKPQGKIVLHAMISDYEYDIFVKYSPSRLIFSSNNLEPGWNIISRKTLNLICESNSAKLENVKPFELSIEIDKNEKDYMRSWTEKDLNEIKHIYNATHLRQPQHTAVIRKI